MFFFFFSSRRRHTRPLRDWSSDVCSSDLTGHAQGWMSAAYLDAVSGADRAIGREIGRASCRERVSISVVAVSLKKKPPHPAVSTAARILERTSQPAPHPPQGTR